MARTFVALAAVAALQAAAAPPPGEPSLPTAVEVMRKLDDLYRSTSSRGRMKMVITTARYHRELELELFTRGDEQALVVVRAPAREAGTATLRTEEGLWSYAPRADRLVRIPSGLLSESWMGSHLTNDDLVRETELAEDYEVKLSWAEEGGRRVLRATLTPKPDAPVVYTRVEYLLDGESWLPLRAEFFDGAKQVRTETFSQVKPVSGRRLPTVIEVVPTDKPKESTRLEYVELELGVPVDPEVFTQRGLRRAASRR